MAGNRLRQQKLICYLEQLFLKQVAVLSQRGRAMLPVCLVGFNSTTSSAVFYD